MLEKILKNDLKLPEGYTVFETGGSGEWMITAPPCWAGLSGGNSFCPELKKRITEYAEKHGLAVAEPKSFKTTLSSENNDFEQNVIVYFLSIM